MIRRPSQEALREAARLAREEGVTVRVVRKEDGWVYEIAPAAQSALTAIDEDRQACDEAFGL